MMKNLGTYAGTWQAAKIRGCIMLKSHAKRRKFKVDFVPLSQKIGGARAPLAPPVPTALTYFA